MIKDEKKIMDFCASVKKGFGSIVDVIVKKDFERIYETSLEAESLGALLALLETHDLLDKRHSINKGTTFYRDMYKKMKS